MSLLSRRSSRADRVRRESAAGLTAVDFAQRPLGVICGSVGFWSRRCPRLWFLLREIDN